MPEASAYPALAAILEQARAALDTVRDASGTLASETLGGGADLDGALRKAAALGEFARDFDYRAFGLMATAIVPGIQAIVAEVASEADVAAAIDAVCDLLKRTAHG
ncbi:MAG: hypothetical protein HY875_10415 [Chloroflexi bacterium]|nr:hypothetical protein [Chloroflexota bacterium]